MNEKLLFHGTRSANPEEIYKDVDVAFDSRFSRAGMWGKATYFAMNASYSKGYAYNLGNGTLCMFLAKVVLGEIIQLPSNGNLIRPPNKPNSKELYDSVQGNTGGSDVFMVYDQMRAYPLYLITFR